jgi:hypothetical protein
MCISEPSIWSHRIPSTGWPAGTAARAAAPHDSAAAATRATKSFIGRVIS